MRDRLAGVAAGRLGIIRERRTLLPSRSASMSSTCLEPALECVDA
jgi:hypothetical protein